MALAGPGDGSVAPAAVHGPRASSVAAPSRGPERGRTVGRRRVGTIAATLLLVGAISACAGDGATTEPPIGVTTTDAGVGMLLDGEPATGPAAGTHVAVVGVPQDSALNVRSAPSTDAPAVATLPSDAAGLVTTGAAWAAPDRTWYQIAADDTTGWANSSYLAMLGGTEDLTVEVETTMGRVPAADTIEHLGRLVAETVAGADTGATIVESAAPAVDEQTGTVTFDVIGIDGDPVAGVRLSVVGYPIDVESGFSLMSVSRTWLCAAGIDVDGRCV